MANGQVGRLSIRVLPDTTQFRRDLKKAVDRAEKAVTAQIDATVNITNRSLANAKRQLEGLEATVPVMAEIANGAKQRVQEQLDGIDATATVDVDVDHGAASAKIRGFTRPRILPVHVKVNKASLAAAASAVAALSGARVLGNFGRSIKNAITSLDRALPSLAAGATAITTLGAAGLAATSNLFALGASLVSILPAALALPGIFAGFGVGLGVMVAALADTGDVLGDLGPKFAALQDNISAQFWERAAGPIRELANNVLPLLNTRLGEIGSELGGFFASAAGALNTPMNMGLLDGMLANLRDSIDIAADGIGSFINAIMGLGSVGASYLPQLAGWFNDIAASFEAWVQTNTENGNLFTWIDAGVVALQDLGRVLGATGGILGGFATAAANAGGANLGALADGLERVNTAVNGPAFQGALTTVFQGAHDAMAALGPGVAALGDAFTDFAPTLAEIMVLAGEIGSVGLTAIADAFQNPAFQGGLTDFFEGVLTGVEAIAPHIPALAEAFGSVASFAGTLAAVLGPVLGAAIGALAPVVTDLMGGLSAIAPILGGVLVSAIQAVAPLIQQVVGAIVSWIEQNPGLATGLLVAAGAIGGLILGAVSLITALAPLISSIIGIVAGLAGMGVSFAGVGTAILGFLGPVLAIIAGIAALAALLVYAWTTSETFRNAVIGLATAILAYMQPIIAFITGTVIPVVVQVAQAFMSMVMQIVNALIPMITVIIQIVTQIIAIMTPLVAFVLSVLAPVFTFLGSVVSAAFTFIGTVISTIINIITSILQVFLALLQGNWSAAWAAVKNVAVTMWEGIKAIIGAAIDFVWSVIQSGLQMIQGVWNAIWSAIGSFVSSVWNAIWSAITSFVARIVAAVVGFVNSVKSKIQSGFNAAKDAAVSAWQTLVSRIRSFISNLVSAIVSFVSNVKSNIQNGFSTAKQMAVDAFQRLVSGVKDKIGNLISDVKALPGRIKSGLGNMGSLLTSAGKDLIQGMINGIKDMAGSLVDAAKGVVDGAVDGAKNLLGIASPSKVFMEIGEYTGEGMIVGLEHKARGVNSAMSSMVTPPSLPSVGSASGGSGAGESGGLDLSDASIERLADAMLRRPLKIGNRQAGMLSAAGAGSKRSMGGNW